MRGQPVGKNLFHSIELCRGRPRRGDNLQMDPMTLTLTFAAFLTAALSGLAGLGGGTVLIAVFFAMGLTPLEAVPLFAVVQFVSNSSRTVAYARHVNWRAVGWFLLALIPATVAVTPLIAGIDVNAIRLLLAALILLSLLPGRLDVSALPPTASSLLAGFLNGALGMLVGATGLFTGRLFLRPQWTKQSTIATLAMTQVMGHGLRVLAFGTLGFNAFSRPGLLIPLCVAVILGTWLGKRLNTYLSADQFAAIFKLILVLLCAKLIIDSVGGL